MRNRYSGKCFRCGEMVETGKGHFQVNFIKKKGKWERIDKTTNNRWIHRCKSCIGKGNLKINNYE